MAKAGSPPLKTTEEDDASPTAAKENGLNARSSRFRLIERHFHINKEQNNPFLGGKDVFVLLLKGFAERLFKLCAALRPAAGQRRTSNVTPAAE